MKNYIITILCVFTLSIGFLCAQTKPSAYVDKKGVLRWTTDNKEVNEFGVNYTLPFAYAYLAHKNLNISLEKAIDDDVYHITRLGLTAYRIHVWDTEISDTLGNLLDNEHLRLFDYTLKKMKERGFKFLLTPIAFWDGFPEKGEKLPGFSHKYGKNNSYTNPEAIKAAERYLYQFMNHVNRYTGIAYKDDPDIIAFEISNEPEHPTETAEETTPYINRLVKAIRSTGCTKPLFYCMSIAPRLLNAFLDADVQGGSTQWYPFSHNSGFNKRGNFLTNIDSWPKDTITGKIKARNKALISYEIDAADNLYTYTYPVMARELRKAGFQFTTMFSYDPLYLAYANTEYRTHYLNLAYVPQKALSLKIAGEVFHRIPMGKTFGTYPVDTLFDSFRVSYDENLAEMLTEEKFMYANNTKSMPPAPNKLKEIAGYGSSPVVQYNGRGAYFLDKLDDGIWRLEVMPDATIVADPFANPSLDKEVSAIVWNNYPMTIELPDLGSEYNIVGLNKGNSTNQTAQDQQINVSPGSFLLVRKGVISKWGSDDKWKNITLGEYVAPDPTKNSYVLHQPFEEITKGNTCSVKVEVISAKEPDKVEVIIPIVRGEQKRTLSLEMKQISRYSYVVSIPDTLLQKEGFLKYQIQVGSNGQSKIYPADVVLTSSVRRDFNLNNQMYTTRIVNKAAPVCLFDVEADKDRIIKPHRRFSLIYRPSELPGKSGVIMDSGNISYMGYFFGDKVLRRQADMVSKRKLLLRGYALSDTPVKLWVSLQLKDGSEWGQIVSISKKQLIYELPVNKFQRILLTGPGEKGPVSIKPYPIENDGYPFENESNGSMNLIGAETIKLTVPPTGNPAPQSVIEYITLE